MALSAALNADAEENSVDLEDLFVIGDDDLDENKRQDDDEDYDE